MLFYIIYYMFNNYLVNLLLNLIMFTWGLGIGDWGLQSPIPNPQSPIILTYKSKLTININYATE